MGVKDRSTIKGLQTTLQKLEGEYEALKIAQAKTQEELAAKKAAIKDLKQKIHQFGNEFKVEITDHAILRYLERVHGIDVSEIKSKILTDKMKFMIETLGNGTFPGDGYKLRVVDKKIVTIIV